MNAATALLLAATLEGRVVLGEGSLPGCTVTLQSGDATHTAITDVNGEYAFADVAEGQYKLHFTFDGLQPSEREVEVEGEVAVVADERMKLSPLIRGAVCTRVCRDFVPESPFDYPLCADYEANSALIEAMENGDRSATAMLRRRYDESDTYGERFRIGAALLRHVDDQIIRREFQELAEHAIRFAPDNAGIFTETFERWCAERGLDPYDYWAKAVHGLSAAGEDPRSKPILLRGLEATNELILESVVISLALLHDESSLPAIERTLDRLGEDAPSLAHHLAYFASDAADRIAFKYFDEERYEAYQALRAEVTISTP